MNMTRQNLYGREFKILEGDGLTGMCEGAIDAGGGVLATNTAMMCRPFCASGAGNPIISAHRTPFPGFQWDEVWFGYQGFTSEEEFLRSHGFFGSGRCYIVVVDGGEKKLVALEDFVQLCPDVILGPRLKPLGHGMRRYSKFFINRSRLPHHTHDVKEEAYWIEPAMIVDFDLFDEQCFMAVGLHERFRTQGASRAPDPPGLGRSGEGSEAARALGVHAPRCGDDHENPDPPRAGRFPAPLRAAVLRRRVSDVRADAQDSALTARGPRDPGAPARRSRLRMPTGTANALLDYLVSDDALDWASIHDPRYSERHTCTPLLDRDTCDGRDVTDHWIVYGAFGRQNNHQVFASKRLVIQPGVKYQLQDPVGSDLIVVQGMGKIGAHLACAPRALKPGDLGNWCFIVPAGTANSVSIENTGDTELVASADLRSGSSDDASAALAGSLDARSETLTGASSTISVRTGRGLKPAPYFPLVAWLPRGDGPSGLWILLSVFCLTYS